MYGLKPVPFKLTHYSKDELDWNRKVRNVRKGGAKQLAACDVQALVELVE
jgi:hypothetical protein